MKKRIIIVAAFLIAAILVSMFGYTLARYVEELVNTDGQITNPKIYFYSDVLKEAEKTITSDGAELPEVIEIYDTSATVHLYNSINDTQVSNVDINYTLTYYVEIDGVWTEMDKTTGQLKASEGMNDHEITVAPIEEYDEVIVEAVSSAPYSKILSAYFRFVTAPYSVNFEYDREMGVIKMILATNSDSGRFHIEWVNGVLPDNADPNGILTEGEAGDYSVEVDLEAFTTYDLYFFISGDVRAELDAVLDSADTAGNYEEIAAALISGAIKYNWVIQNP